tara:strand:- start:381 stop:893 length:513 start_codon:yes stop_codon:yes gene_type:complete
MKKFFLILIFFFKINVLNAEVLVAYIDINFILNSSIAGKSINNHISSLKEKNLKKYNIIENDLKDKRDSLVSQQNIIDKNEFEKKAKQLDVEIAKYRSEIKKLNNDLNKKKIDNTKKILEVLNPIITQYVEENSISIVLPKKNIIIGKKKLDITNEIFNLLNDEMKEIKF